MSGFSDDMLSQILCHLPVQSAVACKLVCKRWLSLISSHALLVASYTDMIVVTMGGSNCREISVTTNARSKTGTSIKGVEIRKVSPSRCTSRTIRKDLPNVSPIS